MSYYVVDIKINPLTLTHEYYYFKIVNAHDFFQPNRKNNLKVLYSEIH